MTSSLLRFGEWQFATRPLSGPAGLGLAILGLHDAPADAPEDYLHTILLADAHRAAFFDLVDREGLVVCENVACSHPTYRFVRGRSSRGRLSQGEYYHHDGCSGPVKPRVVEIRFPHQPAARRVATAVAPFPETVIAMLHELPPTLASRDDLPAWRARVDAGETLSREDWDTLQGRITRVIRKELDAEQARAWFRVVDARLGAWVFPWQWGESRFIANNNAGRTFQHRRAYLEPASDGRENGNLVKRWPAEEL
jgi:hypothetical protein